MTGTLYRPLDESFVRGLAFMLTEEMDNCAEDYRQTDQHAIAAMSNESYEVPPAYCLPKRMNEYYEFLQKTDVHPLIKAAVAQAYLLVTRPFPEGNERLSRMMSSAVLLRCGYDFFRDISVSAMIAKESYRYYKCMCEIIRSENGGDMTYFMEYFLELLVRAIDARNERLRRREQEALEQEREMAKQPLKKTEEAVPDEEAVIKGRLEEHVQWNEAVPDGTSELPPEEEQSGRKKAITPQPLMTLDKFLEKVDKLKYSPIGMNRGIPSKVRMIVGAGLFAFTARQWSDITDTDIKQSDYECRFLLEKGWADRERGEKRFVYKLRIASGANDNGVVKTQDPGKTSEETQGGVVPVPFEGTPATGITGTVAGGSPPVELDFYNRFKQMEDSKSERIRKSAAMVREMLEDGITRFTRADWAVITGMEWKDVCDTCDYLVSHKLVVNVNRRHNHSEYVFNLPDTEQTQEETGCGENPADEYSPLLIARLQKMVTAGSSERDKRIGEFILNMIDNDIERFTTEDWVEAFHVTKTVYTSDLRRAVNLGLLRKENPHGQCTHYSYAIPRGPYEEIRCLDLTRAQRELLGQVYGRFKKNEFTVRDAARATEYSETSIYFHLTNFAERGIMAVHDHPEYPGHAQAFSLAIFPKDHPQCFAHESRHSAAGGEYIAERVPFAAASS